MSIKVTRNGDGGYTASGRDSNGNKVSAKGWNWASAIINLLKVLGLACVLGAIMWVCI